VRTTHPRGCARPHRASLQLRHHLTRLCSARGSARSVRLPSGWRLFRAGGRRTR
jgi:hypothetical protein